MIVTTTAQHDGYIFGDTVVTFEGTDQRTGDTVVFGVDHRPARELAALLNEQGEVDCQVEGWQVVSRTPSPERAALIAARTNKAAFLSKLTQLPGATITLTVDLAGDQLPISGLGRLRPGDGSSYASIEVSLLNASKPEGRQYSTHTLIFNDERGAWVLESGHYDLDEATAASDLAQR